MLASFLSHVYAQKLNFSTYNLEGDYGISNITDIASSQLGYLYLGANESIYQFDGNSFDPVSVETLQPFSEIADIKEIDQADMAFVANQYIYVLGDEDPLIDEKVNVFDFYQGKWLLGTDNGLVFFDLRMNFISRPEELEALSNFVVRDLKLKKNILYISTNKGLYRYDLLKNRLENMLVDNDGNYFKIALDSSLSIWTYNDNGELIKVSQESKEVETFKNPGYSFTSIQVDEKNRVWFGSSNKGILRFDTATKIWKSIDVRNGLSDDRIIDIEMDAWGELWILTADQVLSKFVDKDFSLYNVYDGLPSDRISAISGSDRLLVAAGANGISQFTNQKFRPFLSLSSVCEAILEDSLTLWLGTKGQGLLMHKVGETTNFSTSSGLPSDWITHIAKSKYGEIWIGTPSNGLASIFQKDSSGYEIRVYGEEQGLINTQITALHADPTGPIYYGTKTGVIGEIFLGQHRMLNESAQFTSEITDISQDDTGRLFFGTSDQGVYEYTSGKKARFEKLSAWPNHVRALEFHKKKLYVVNDQGIFTDTASFSISEGFPTRRARRSSMLTYSDDLWIATDEGLLRVGDISTNEKKIIPRLHFTDIQVNFQPILQGEYTYGAGTQVAYNENQISFLYEGINVHARREMQYSYILEGRDDSWSPWSRNTNPSFSNLATGNYTFKVKARSSEDAVSDELLFPFAVKGPIWKEWWFIGTLGLVSALLFYLIFKARINAIQKRNDEEKAQLELQNRLLELEQKSNQLQMNPHFIFNALNSIQATVAKENYNEARKEITDFAILMRSILSNSKERVISLADELKLLNKYIDIEKKCRRLAFEKVVKIDEELDPEEVMIPPMLIQPFVENAIVHGLKGINGGQLKLIFNKLDESTIEVSILDNGLGFNNTQNKNNGHKSVAIEVTRERLEALLPEHAKPVVAIKQRTEDGGTEVRLKIPIEYNF